MTTRRCNRSGGAQRLDICPFCCKIRTMYDKPPLPEITQEDWAATPPAIRAVVVALLARIADLEARLNQHSGNSSKPPSSDPPDAPSKPPRTPRGKPRCPVFLPREQSFPTREHLRGVHI